MGLGCREIYLWQHTDFVPCLSCVLTCISGNPPIQHLLSTNLFDFSMLSLTLTSQRWGLYAPTWSEVNFSSLFVRIKKQYISAAVQCAAGCSLLTNKIYVTVNKLTISQSHFYNFSPSSESWKLHRLTQRKFNCGERAAMWSKNANSLS